MDLEKIETNRKLVEKVRRGPNIREIRSAFGKYQKLYINSRIERVTLRHETDPEKCIFIPILERIVVVSDVEPGAMCFAVPINSADKIGYQLVTVSDYDNSINSKTMEKIPSNAIKGLTFFECALKCDHIRQKYWNQVRLNNNRPNSLDDYDSDDERPKLIVRYGAPEVVKKSVVNKRYRRIVRNKSKLRRIRKMK